MTRRGSLAYYLAAWIIGCVFMSLAIWLRDAPGAAVGPLSFRTGFGVLLLCFYGLVFGACAALLGAFLLRRVALWLKWDEPVAWVAAGAGLATLLIALLGSWGRRLTDAPRLAPKWIQFATFGPKIVLDAGWWLAIPVGAATAFVLYRIDRAFAMQPGGRS
jgi:hypothetical protein